MMELMCNLYLDIEKMNQTHGIHFLDYFATELSHLESMIEDGLLEVYEQAIEVTETGRLLIRNIAMRFDRFHNHQARRYSKTI
jgi:oxygen-independent coproporphyrinogen-3 oxidase